MLGPAGDMDLARLAPHRAAPVGAMADDVRLAEQGHLGAVGERPPLRQPLQAGGDPAGLGLGEAHGGAAGHAQGGGQHDPAAGRVDAQRGPAGAGAAHEGHGQGIAGMNNGQLLGLGWRFRQDEAQQGAGQRHARDHTTEEPLT